MRYCIFIVILFSLNITLVGQQKPQFTQYMLNKYGENPAYGGLERSLSVFASYRDQYSNFPGNPRTFYLGADMPFYLWSGAVGFTFFNQKTGVFNSSNLKFSYNYVMNMPYGFLSFGGRVGIDFNLVDGSGIITPQGNYEGVFNHNDPTLETRNFSGAGLSWEIGTYFMGSSLEAGITLAELPSHSYGLGEGKFKRSFSTSLFASYKYPFNNEVDLLPSILLKADAAVFQSDIGFIFKYKENILAGLNLRGYNGTSMDALSVILGTNMGKKYKLVYSYDFGLSSIRSVNQGTHELMVSYNLQKLIGIGLPPKIIYNPRDL